MNILIIGASAAGISCLDTLLKYSGDNNITLVSEEKHTPYSRCLLTYFLGKELGENQLVIKQPSEYPSNITFILGEKVENIDPLKKQAFLNSGTTIMYDKLLIASGADALKPTFCREEWKAFTLRYMDDAKRIEKYIKKSATVVGGGFVGIKTACGLIQRGIKVNLIISSPYPLAMALDEITGKLVETELSSMGISVITKTDVEEINTSTDRATIILSNGTELTSDVVVVGKGVKPRTELARNAGIKTNMGIKVNHFLETSTPDVYAAGDCCEAFDVIKKTATINAIWPVAVEQGYFAALNILGFNTTYPGSISMNSMKTDRFHLITAGTLKGCDIVTYESSCPEKKQIRKIALRGDVMVGLSFFNSHEDAGIFVNLIKRGAPLKVAPETITDGTACLLDVLKSS